MQSKPYNILNLGQNIFFLRETRTFELEGECEIYHSNKMVGFGLPHEPLPHKKPWFWRQVDEALRRSLGVGTRPLGWGLTKRRKGLTG